MSKNKFSGRKNNRKSSYIYAHDNNSANIRKIIKNSPGFMMTRKARIINLKRQRFVKNKRKR